MKMENSVLKVISFRKEGELPWQFDKDGIAQWLG